MVSGIVDSKIGFSCPGSRCGDWIGDPHYVGPAGHAPQNLCLDCWAAHWDVIEARAINGGEWTHLDEALWLVCRGLSLGEAADVLGAHRNTLWRWIVEMRRRPETVPDWLLEAGEKQRQQEIQNQFS